MLTQDKFVKEKEHKRLYGEVLKYITREVSNIMTALDTERVNDIEEIRMRAGRPLMVQSYEGDWFVKKNGILSKKHDNAYVTSMENIQNTLELMSQSSIYAYQEELRMGYITLKGGHRVGITGKAVVNNKNIKTLKDISGLNIRIAREVKGCGRKILNYLVNRKAENDIFNTLIVSPPQCGKTTILRDLSRLLSNGFSSLKGLKVGIVDERAEIASCYNGIPQYDVGIRTDVIDCCPKVSGLEILIRSMSPHILVTDEIGDSGDFDAIIKTLNAGVKIITSAHGYNISELKSRDEVLKLIKSRVFERYVVLSNINGPGTVEEIVDGQDMKLIYRRIEDVS